MRAELAEKRPDFLWRIALFALTRRKCLNCSLFGYRKRGIFHPMSRNFCFHKTVWRNLTSINIGTISYCKVISPHFNDCHVPSYRLLHLFTFDRLAPYFRLALLFYFSHASAHISLLLDVSAPPVLICSSEVSVLSFKMLFGEFILSFPDFDFLFFCSHHFNIYTA